MNQPPETLKELREHGNVEFPCAFYTFLNEEIHAPHHWHEEIELLYIEGTDYSMEIDTRDISVPGPAFYFVNSGKLHALTLPKTALEYAVVFRLEMLSFSSYDLAQQELILPLISRKLSFPACVPADTPAGAALKERLLPLFRAPVSCSPEFLLKVKSSLLDTLVILKTHGLLLLEENTDKRESQKIQTIKLLLSYIQKNYSRRIYLQELADTAGMDPQYLCRFFKKSLGQTPMEYINNYRIERSCEALRSSDAKILEICYDCGFQNIGHFINCFKNAKKMTPSAYRSLLPPERLP